MLDKPTEALLSKIPSDPFFATLGGGYPTLPSVAALPTASDLMRGKVLILRGAPDVAYFCGHDGSGLPSWIALS